MSRASRLSRAALLSLTLLSFTLAAACRLDSRADASGDAVPKRLGLGHAPAAATLAMEDIDVRPDGAGLPTGSGTPQQGAAIFAASCASCHGARGEGMGTYPQLIGGPRGTFNFASDYKIPRTIGNYWPYATTLYDYIRRAMPLTAPGSLTTDQTYAVTAFLLNREGIIGDGETLDKNFLINIEMPAKAHFVGDDRRPSSGGKDVR